MVWVRVGSRYELVLGKSLLGYELAWYDLARVRVDWHPTDSGTNGHGTTAKTALTRSVSWLKLCQIVIMCCCTASIIHTYLLLCPVDSNSIL